VASRTSTWKSSQGITVGPAHASGNTLPRPSDLGSLFEPRRDHKPLPTPDVDPNPRPLPPVDGGACRPAIDRAGGYACPPDPRRQTAGVHRDRRKALAVRPPGRAGDPVACPKDLGNHPSDRVGRHPGRDRVPQVPTGFGAPAPRDAGHCITHRWVPAASDDTGGLSEVCLNTQLSTLTSQLAPTPSASGQKEPCPTRFP